MPKFPHYLQPDAMDCGSTSLRIVARYFGRHFNMESLRQLTWNTREGVSLLSISDAAEKTGFRTQGVRISVSNLGNIALPAILHWDQNHFVVLYEVRKSRKGSVYRISDPAIGLIDYSEEEFLRHWASVPAGGEKGGIALLLEPTPEFYKQETSATESRGFGFLFAYLKPYRKLIAQVLLGFLTGSFLSLLFPFLTQAMVDVGITTSNLNFIVLVLIAQLVLMISQTAVTFIRSWIMLHVSARVSISLISDFLIKLMRLPVRFFDTKLTGDLRQRIEDNNRIQHFLTTSLVNMSSGLFMFVIYIFVLAWYSWKILFLFLIGSLLYIVWIFLFMKRRRDLDALRFDAMAANQTKIYQLITGMQEIKLTNSEKQKRWEWEQIQVRLYKVSMRALMLHQNQHAGSIFINQAKNILIIFLAARSVLDGSMTLGMLIAVQFIIGQLNAPVQEFVSFVTSAQDARLSLERLNEVQAVENEEQAAEGKLLEPPQCGELVLENVTFQYEGPRSPKVLEEVSLTIPERSVTALVGPSGSGKTTLIKLLLGFYPPAEGKIKLGKVPLEQYGMGKWRSWCGAVMQDGFIFSDTIAGNIAVGEESPDRTRLRQAVKIAQLEEFIESLPLRYQTKIGQEGSGLSQGQKQRILIARAVYKNPLFLFLDEATNALDADNEKTVLENLKEFYENRTVLVVAHRLSTVKNADRIYVLMNGRIAESGTHDQLTAKRGVYYHLVKNQLELGA